MQKIIEKYQGGVEKNIKQIKQIVESLGMPSEQMIPVYKNILDMSSQNLASKWQSGRKYARTIFVQKAFGKQYPEEMLDISLTIDAMVNILDDMYDEDLNKEEIGLFIIELVRLFAILNNFSMNEKINKEVGLYFNELVTLAIAEKIYLDLIKKENNFEQIIKYSAGLIMCRAMDIDIFNDIALDKYDDAKSVELVKLIGRVFRAVNLIRKDILDITYDKERGMESVITYVLGKEGYSFNDYIEGLLSILMDGTAEFGEPFQSTDLDQPITKYQEMIQEDIVEIRDIINKKYSSK